MNLHFTSGQSLEKAYPVLPSANLGYQTNNQYERFSQIYYNKIKLETQIND